MVNLFMLLKAENQNPIQIPVFIKAMNVLSSFSSRPYLIPNSFRRNEQQKEKSQGLKLFGFLSKEEVK